MERHEVRELIAEEIGGFIQLKECPVCKDLMPMFKWHNFNRDDDSPQYRCMGCLKVFIEKLEEVKDGTNYRTNYR